MAINILEKLGLDKDKTKVTVIPMLEFLNGKIDEVELKEFAQKFAIKSSGNSSGKPREATKLYDAEGNLLGGRCSATGKWFAIENYNHHHGLAKEAQNVKSRLNTEAKKIEAEAEKFLEAARSAQTPNEKLKAFEAYDKEIERAKQVRNKEITPKDFAKQVPFFETVEDLAKALKVPVITTKPKAEKDESKEEAGE